MFSINLPTTTVSDISANTTSILADLSPIFTLLIGIFLAFMIIRFLISLMN